MAFEVCFLHRKISAHKDTQIKFVSNRIKRNRSDFEQIRRQNRQLAESFKVVFNNDENFPRNMVGNFPMENRALIKMKPRKVCVSEKLRLFTSSRCSFWYFRLENTLILSYFKNVIRHKRKLKDWMYIRSNYD